MKNNIIHDFSYQKKWKGVTLTKSAVQRILQLMHDNPSILGLKITIKKSGCAGFSYNIIKMVTIEENTMIYERDGAKLFVPFDVMSIIDGTELDYVQEGLSFSFKFNNPKVQYSCGCGESFKI